MYNKEAAEGLKKKLKSFSDRELGMQIGACLNKAVDIAISIAENNSKKGNPIEHKNMERTIKVWTDILFKIGTEKKFKEKQKELNKYDQAEDKVEQVKGDLTDQANKEADLAREDIPVLEE